MGCLRLAVIALEMCSLVLLFLLLFIEYKTAIERIVKSCFSAVTPCTQNG